MADGDERTAAAVQVAPHSCSTEVTDAAAVTDENLFAATSLGLPEWVSGVHGTWGDVCYETPAPEPGQRRSP